MTKPDRPVEGLMNKWEAGCNRRKRSLLSYATFWSLLGLTGCRTSLSHLLFKWCALSFQLLWGGYRKDRFQLLSILMMCTYHHLSSLLSYSNSVVWDLAYPRSDFREVRPLFLKSEDEQLTAPRFLLGVAERTIHINSPHCPWGMECV